jgi:hypothetical protein
MESAKPTVDFGKSQFKGRSGFYFELYRWVVQFCALLIKNFAVMFRRPFQLALFLILPSAVFFTFLIQNHDVDDGKKGSEVLYPASPIEDIGACNVHYSSKCIRVAFGPITSRTTEIMTNFCDLNDLTYDDDVRGFDTVSSCIGFHVIPADL